MRKNGVQDSDYFEVFAGGPVRPDPEGLVLLRDDTKSFDEYRFSAGKVIDDWPEGITFYMQGKHYEDYLVVGLQWMVVSERVRKVFTQYEVSGVQFLPVHIVIENTGMDIGPYWALNVFQEIEALDWEQTVWTHPEKVGKDEYSSLDILKEALRAEPLTNVDIFRLLINGESDVTVYISKRIKESIEQAGADSGFKFNPVPTF